MASSRDVCMTLEQDLTAWLAGRTDWQRDAVARLCGNESPSAEHIAAITDRLIAGTHPAGATIAVADLPGTSATGDPVTLIAISGVAGVNALMAGQEVTFGASGLTIIYGDNGSGKSGYARLIREAMTARIKADLLGDVYAKESADQVAMLRYAVGAVESTWALDTTSARHLSAIRGTAARIGDI